MKPILFNTEMVQAILSGRKTATRRIVKPQPMFRDGETGTPEPCDDGNWCFKIDQYHNIYDFDLKPSYQRGDILYVRETWRVRNMFGDWSRGDRCAEIEFRAKGEKITLRNIDPQFEKWQKGARWLPAIHMPKDAARIFLRVTNLRMERLQSITESDAKKEGVSDPFDYCADNEYWKSTKRDLLPADIAAFSALWDSTVKAKERELYGWDANPWVWVFEYELCEKPNNHQEHRKELPLTLNILRNMVRGTLVWDNFLMEYCTIGTNFSTGETIVRYRDGKMNPLSEKRFYHYKPSEDITNWRKSNRTDEH